MLLSTAEDIAAFVQELQLESDRGLPLIATSLIDELLRETLRAFFLETKSTEYLIDEGNAPLGTFSARIHTCFALGLINEYEKSESQLLRKVRNLFAHNKHGFSFADAKVVGLCSSLKSDLPNDDRYDQNNARFRFINASVCLVLRLYHRPDWVALQRRTLLDCVDNHPTQWRSFDTDPPPAGQAYIAIGQHGVKVEQTDKE